MIEAGEAEVARHYSEAAIVAAYIGLYAACAIKPAGALILRARTAQALPNAQRG